ncbi:hypothetical protein N4599_02715 [Limosilactobacillus oris]|uniref:hypothetical protein n=1 Tax=Limosilactobacillus oris TaxID=1632 RepID=UPI0021B33EC9|nr:hypothetical protein [Limosilactobacillus oris]UXC67874.1 hypothetical protein N4599_02715 [Limosilactobacillus oris]
MDKLKNNVPAFNKRHNPNLSKALYNNPKRSFPVLFKSRKGERWHRFASIAEAERQTGISATAIASACYADNKSRQKGYWMFEKDVTLKAKQERDNRQLGGAYGI